jgi:hypothetical protein
MKHDECQLTLSEDDRPLRGGKAIAQAIGKKKRTVQDWLRQGIIPARLVAGQYEATLRKLREHYRGGSTHLSRKRQDEPP